MTGFLPLTGLLLPLPCGSPPLSSSLLRRPNEPIWPYYAAEQIRESIDSGIDVRDVSIEPAVTESKNVAFAIAGVIRYPDLGIVKSIGRSAVIDSKISTVDLDRLNQAMQPLHVMLNSLQARREKQIFDVGLLLDHPLLELIADNRF